MDVRLLHSKTTPLILLPYQNIMNHKYLLHSPPPPPPPPCRPLIKTSPLRSSNHDINVPQSSDDTSLKKAYHDSWLDLMVINHVSHSLQATAGITVEKEGYDGLLEACKAVTTRFDPVQQRRVVLECLNGAIPTPIRIHLGHLMASIRHTQSIRELFAIFTGLFFVWLIGPSQVKESEFNGRREKNVAHITKCRFLESSNCVGMCTNLCKLPTQQFIKDFMGMPVTMVPNFDDMSCEMIFGVEPPEVDEDPATRQPCYKQCKIGKTHTNKSCPTFDTY